jgi:cytochrome P450
MHRNPYPFYDHIRSTSPIVHDPQTHFWMIFDYDGVSRCLSDCESFSSRAAPPEGGVMDLLVFMDPPRHTKMRALIQKAFTPRSVANLEPRIRILASDLLDLAIKRGQMDLATDFAIPLPMMVIAEMLGVPTADRPKFWRWNEAILGMIFTVTGGERAAQAIAVFTAATAEMTDYLTAHLVERRSTPRDDLLTRLVQAEVDGERLTNLELRHFFQLLLIAGSETTSNLIGNAMLCFMENPGELARLRSHMELLPSAIEEVLRYRSPFQTVFRMTKRDVEMKGQVIPAGMLVLVMIGSANRDPHTFPDPNRFDISRDPNPHVGFGHGTHFCLGAPLARLEARIALTALLHRFKSFRLADDTPWEPRKAFHVHGPTRLPIQFEIAR